MLRLLKPRVNNRVSVRSHLQRWWKWFAIIFFSLCLLLGFLIFKGTNKPAEAPRSTAVATVSVAPAKMQPLPHSINVTGTVAAIDLLTITPEANGLRIVSVPVEEGQFVSKGQLLAQLDSSLLRAQLSGAQARLSGAQAALSRTIQPNRPQELLSLKQAVRQAQADVSQRRALVSQAESNAANAADVATRFEMLAREQAVSEVDARAKTTEAKAARQSVEAAKAQLQAAQFATQQAQQRLEIGQSGGMSQDIASAQATVREAQATIAQLQTQINQTSVIAPDSGLITKRDAHIGDVSSPSKSMFQMVRRGELEVLGQLSQRDLLAVSVGQPVKVSDGIRTATGNIWQISPTLDPTTRLGTVRIRLPGNSVFRPGMFAKGNVELGTIPALTVPSSAVLAEGTQAFVYVLSRADLSVHRRQIQVGVRNAQLAQILTNLNPGEEVVMSGAGFLSDGDVVKVSQ